MKRSMVAGALMALGVVSASGQDTAETPITRVDHFYAESGSMEVLLDFLKRDLGLPEAWPDQDYGVFATGAVSLGNVTFEVLRNEETDGSGAARFGGIALEPARDTESLLEWLDRRGIDHGAPQRFPPQGPPFFENTTLPRLIPGGADVFVCDYKDREMILAGQAEGRAGLEATGGGPLGLLGVKELLVESTDVARSLRAWAEVVAGAKSEGTEVVVDFDAGPRIRIQPGPADRFGGIVLSVRSLDGAREFLEARGLDGPPVSGGLTITPTAVEGLHIVLVEG